MQTEDLTLAQLQAHAQELETILATGHCEATATELRAVKDSILCRIASRCCS